MENSGSLFQGLDLFFLICAGIGGIVVFSKIVMQFFGGETDTSFETAGDFDHSDSDLGFQILSVHGLSSFFMMFGLVGLALHRQDQVGSALSMAGAVVAGGLSVWLIRALFRGAVGLQSSGTLDTARAVGCTGTVYLTIPHGGTGRVSLNFHNHLREFDAVAEDGAALPTGTPVRVVETRGNVLIVENLN